jgi:excisionase family DNA binding protein
VIDVLTTKELAVAIGVSESSIKRWIDAGLIRAARTVGGHRRIPRPEAIRFIRETGAAVTEPAVLGLTDLAGLEAEALPPGREAETLQRYLVEGAAGRARGLVQSLYLSGWSVAAIVDGPMRTAMHEIGALWRHDDAGIFLEHRATDISKQALVQLRLTFAADEGGPVAVGGAPEGDPYALPSLAAATVLAAEGFDAVNLGPQTPLPALAGAAQRLRPALAWLAVSSAPAAERLATTVVDLAHELAPLGVTLVVGGRELPPLAAAGVRNLHVAGSMAELAAFGRGLVAGTRSPAATSPQRGHRTRR